MIINSRWGQGTHTLTTSPFGWKLESRWDDGSTEEYTSSDNNIIPPAAVERIVISIYPAELYRTYYLKYVR